MSIYISIICPIFSKDFSLTSLMNQLNKVDLIDLSKIEIIIINDNSPKISDFEIKSIISKIPKQISCKYIKLLDNMGPGFVRNIGIKEAKTKKYLTFVDDDDLPNIKEILKESICSNSDLVISPIALTNKRLPYQKVFKSRLDLLFFYFSGNIKTVAWNKIYKKKYLIKANAQFSNKRLFEDEKMLISIIFSIITPSFSLSKEPFVVVNRRNDSRSRYFKFSSFMIYIDVQKENLQYIKNENPRLLFLWIIFMLPKSFLSFIFSYIRSFYFRRVLSLCKK